MITGLVVIVVVVQPIPAVSQSVSRLLYRFDQIIWLLKYHKRCRNARYYLSSHRQLIEIEIGGVGPVTIQKL